MGVVRKAGLEVPIFSSQQFVDINSAKMIINMLRIRDLRCGPKLSLNETLLMSRKIINAINDGNVKIKEILI